MTHLVTSNAGKQIGDIHFDGLSCILLCPALHDVLNNRQERGQAVPRE